MTMSKEEIENTDVSDDAINKLVEGVELTQEEIENTDVSDDAINKLLKGVDLTQEEIDDTDVSDEVINELPKEFETQYENPLPQKGKKVILQKNETLKPQPEPITDVAMAEFEEQTGQKAKILQALHAFNNKINDIGKHNPEAKEVASNLHKDLQSLVKESLSDKEFFVTKTTALINKAIPTLQRDLGWGDYLANLAKEICNTVTKAVSLGLHGGFFDTKKSNAVKETEKLQDEVLSTQSFLEFK